MKVWKGIYQNTKVRSSKNMWYNVRCAEAKRAQERAWRKLKQQSNANNREKYKKARNEYVRKEPRK